MITGADAGTIHSAHTVRVKKNKYVHPKKSIRKRIARAAIPNKNLVKRLCVCVSVCLSVTLLKSLNLENG